LSGVIRGWEGFVRSQVSESRPGAPKLALDSILRDLGHPPRTSPRVPNERFYWPLPSLVSETDLPQIALSEKSQQIAHQQNDQNCAKPNACASACAPPAVAVVSPSPAKNEHQNNNEYDEHLRSPSLQVATPGLCCRFDYPVCLTVCLNPENFSIWFWQPACGGRHPSPGIDHFRSCYCDELAF
jgi:hypothetical protein